MSLIIITNIIFMYMKINWRSMICQKQSGVEKFRLDFGEIVDELRSVKELEVLQKMLAPVRPTKIRLTKLGSYNFLIRMHKMPMI